MNTSGCVKLLPPLGLSTSAPSSSSSALSSRKDLAAMIEAMTSELSAVGQDFVVSLSSREVNFRDVAAHPWLMMDSSSSSSGGHANAAGENEATHGSSLLLLEESEDDEREKERILNSILEMEKQFDRRRSRLHTHTRTHTRTLMRWHGQPRHAERFAEHSAIVQHNQEAKSHHDWYTASLLLPCLSHDCAELRLLEGNIDWSRLAKVVDEKDDSVKAATPAQSNSNIASPPSSSGLSKPTVSISKTSAQHLPNSKSVFTMYQLDIHYGKDR